MDTRIFGSILRLQCRNYLVIPVVGSKSRKGIMTIEPFEEKARICLTGSFVWFRTMDDIHSPEDVPEPFPLRSWRVQMSEKSDQQQLFIFAIGGWKRPRE
jgi:hypothetical protein